ncbi:MAG: enhanced serine sensitivity protein SseB C-terminal domain-containing protein [Chthoniobacterales bacterium]
MSFPRVLVTNRLLRLLGVVLATFTTHGAIAQNDSIAGPAGRVDGYVEVPKVKFTGEQDGPAEQLLKERLTELFKRDKSVRKAYLAKISTGEETGVALCLESQSGPDTELAEKVGAVFKTIFNAEEHLDILFLNSKQDEEVARPESTVFSAPVQRDRLRKSSGG